MITERGTVKTSVELDEQVVRELNKNSRNLGIVYIVAGIIIFVFGIIITVLDALEGTIDNFSFITLFLSAVFLAIGVLFLFSGKNLNKKLLEMKRVQEAEFFEGYLIVREYTNGEHTATNKIYYNWIVKVKETANFIFLYNTRVTAIAVGKNSLPPNELNTVRVLLKRAPQAAPAQNMQNSGNAAKADVPPADPFAEMTATAKKEDAETTDNKEE